MPVYDISSTEHIDLKNGVLLIPAAHAKNEKSHQIYRSSFAMAQIKALTEFRYCDFLVPGKTGCSWQNREEALGASILNQANYR